MKSLLLVKVNVSKSLRNIIIKCFEYHINLSNYVFVFDMQQVG